MTYNLKSLASYANKIAEECNVEVEESRLGETWSSRSENLRDHYNGFVLDRNKATLKKFALVIKENANYLWSHKNHKRDISKLLREFEVYANNLGLAYKDIFPEGKLLISNAKTKPKPLVIHNFEGQTGGIHQSTPSKMDASHSHTYGCSTFARYNKGEKVTTEPKASDDMVITGYNNQGLPFQIIVDGFYGGTHERIFDFINQEVLPLMDSYAEDLSSAINAHQISVELVKTIASLRKDRAPNEEFTMSIANCYQQGEKIYAAGFGIGDTALVCKRKGGEIEQLVSHTKVDGFKDAFDSWLVTDHSINIVLERNDFFDTRVQPEDEIVGYTSLPYAMESNEGKFLSVNSNPKNPNQQQIEKINLDISSLIGKGDSSLFNQIQNSIQYHFALGCALAEKNKRTGKFGDDCTIASIKVPNAQLQSQLSNPALRKIKSATIAYLNWMDENTQGYRFLTRFSHFYHGDSGKNRAQNILDMIERGETYKDICEAVCTAFGESGYKQHSYSRYLFESIKGEKVLDVNLSDDDFAILKVHTNLNEVLDRDVSGPESTLVI